MPELAEGKNSALHFASKRVAATAAVFRATEPLGIVARYASVISPGPPESPSQWNGEIPTLSGGQAAASTQSIERQRAAIDRASRFAPV